MEHSATTARGLVVVAEDDRSIADLIALYLRRDGYGVHVEGTGDGALSAVRRLAPVAVILDISLPGIDGIDVCRALRDESNWVPVLFVTARDDEVIAWSASSSGPTTTSPSPSVRASWSLVCGRASPVGWRRP